MVEMAGEKRFPFSRRLRIKRRRDFERALRQGVKQRGKWALFCACPNGLPISRIGISVGKRYGNAVARNRAKRIIREAFRLEHTNLPKGLDIVVIPSAGAPALSLDTFGRELVEIIGASRAP